MTTVCDHVTALQQPDCKHESPCFDLWGKGKKVGAASYDRKQWCYIADLNRQLFNGEPGYKRFYRKSIEGIEQAIATWIEQEQRSKANL